MHRIMMQAYVRGCHEAIALYCRAFGAEQTWLVPGPEGEVFHCELSIEGHCLALAESTEAPVTGNTMQFCLHYGQGREDAVRQAYEVLQEGAQILHPLGECVFSPLMTDIIDRFGVRWCLFI